MQHQTNTSKTKQIPSSSHVVVSDLSFSERCIFHGGSLISTDGNEWFRQFAVAGPAFFEFSNAMVWHETRRLVQEWFKAEYDMEIPGSTAKVDVLAKMTQATLVLHVIAAAGFGIRVNWSAFNGLHVKAPALYAVRQKDDSVLLPFHTVLEQTLTNLNLFVRRPHARADFHVPLPLPAPHSWA